MFSKGSLISKSYLVGAFTKAGWGSGIGRLLSFGFVICQFWELE
jgi:hypothetical protein